MSEASNSAHVRLLLADYGAIDRATNKLTVVGAGFTIIGIPPGGEATGPFTVVAVADFDAKFIGESPTIELSLLDEHGETVVLPGVTGELGQPQHIRIASQELQKPAKIEWAPSVAPDGLRPRAMLVMVFQNGLPLQPGRTYTWRLKIDDETRDDWTEPLCVAQVELPAD